MQSTIFHFIETMESVIPKNKLTIYAFHKWNSDENDQTLKCCSMYEGL